MVYPGLEKQGRYTSSTLCEAIENEIDISCLFVDGFKEGNSVLCNAQDVVREIAEELDEPEMHIAKAVAKELWRLRVYSSSEPTQHFQYREGMDLEIDEAKRKVLEIEDEGLRTEALDIIKSLGAISWVQQAA